MAEEEIKRDFSDIDEAFEALNVAEQEHYIRTAEYVEALFLGSCASEIYLEDVKVRVRLKTDMSDTVLFGSKYLGIGKAIVPEFYREERADFTPEELLLFQKNPANGAMLAEQFLSEIDGINATEINIVKELIENQCENWDGTGYPNGLKETDIPILGRIAKVANDLDYIAINKHSEKPFEMAIEDIIKGSGTLYDPVVVGVLKSGKTKLKKIFNKYITQTRAIPTTDCMIKRRTKRPFALFYRPIADVKTQKTINLHAQMRFKDGSNFIDYSQVEHIVKEKNIVNDMGVYFILEACDTMRRLKACGINIGYVALELMPNFFNKRGLLKDVQSAIDDSLIDYEQICFMIDSEVFAKRSKTMQDNVQKLSGLGVKIMLTNCDIEQFTLNELLENGIKMVSIKSECGSVLDKEETTAYLSLLNANSIKVIADGIDKKSHQALFSRNKIGLSMSILNGDFTSEDEMIETELAMLEA